MEKILFISDVKNPNILEKVLKKLDHDIDQVVIAGDLLSHDWVREINPIEKGREILRNTLEFLRDYWRVLFLPGNTDLRPDLCEDICYSLDVGLLTDRVEGIIYASGLFEGRGYSLISWGPGAGIGGIRGYKQELELLGKGRFPHSTIFLDSQSPEPVNPIYSGRLFYETFKEKLREAKSERKIVVSHMPPYMGNDIPQLSNPATTNEWLDVVIFSRVKGANYSFTHVGDIFFRKALNENHNSIDSVYFGHVEEGRGEAYLGNTYLRNLGSLSENLYIIKL